MSILPELSDEAFLLQLQHCTLPKSYFTHIGHIRLAWICLNHHELDEAISEVKAMIKRYAASLGASHIYHETMTEAWVRIVKNAMKKDPTRNFVEFTHINDHILNSKFIYGYYSADCLNADLAKTQWVKPDLQNLNEDTKMS